MRVEEYVGQRIRDRREELGMTQEDLGIGIGNLLGSPWSRQTVSAAEKGKRAFTAAELVVIAKVLETRAARLLTPPVEVRQVELPNGVRLGTRELADFGVADKLLSDMWDDLVRVIEGAAETLDRSQQTALAAKSLGDKLTTAIAAAETATMHSDRTEKEQS
ncbi:MAG: helix-turn-helix transcriptional regulator [Streptosporangiaceae bacterium]